MSTSFNLPFVCKPTANTTQGGLIMKMKCLLLTLSVLFSTAILGGCNTMEGAGRDVEEAGEGIQDAAD